MRINPFRTAFVILIMFLTGCAVQLAPQYDAALFKSVTHTNVKIMELFASVSGGTDPSTCNTRAKAFNSVIGSVDALAIQASARPVPESDVIEQVNAFLASRGGTGMVIGGSKSPSSLSLEQVSKLVSKMKQVDCESGLKPGAVATFKNGVVISMDQVITYESFLNR